MEKKRWLRRKDVQPYIKGDVEAFFAWENIHENAIRRELIEAHDEYARQKHPYFVKTRAFASALGCTPMNLDLFSLRADSHGELFSRLNRNNRPKFCGVEALTEFAINQLELFREMVGIYSPDRIVIANATACRVVSEMGWGLEYDRDVGFHRWKVEGQTRSVFFSSPLSGAGVVDDGSYQRLQWHIRWTLEAGD